MLLEPPEPPEVPLTELGEPDPELPFDDPAEPEFEAGPFCGPWPRVEPPVLPPPCGAEPLPESWPLRLPDPCLADPVEDGLPVDGPPLRAASEGPVLDDPELEYEPPWPDVDPEPAPSPAFEEELPGPLGRSAIGTAPVVNPPATGMLLIAAVVL